MPGFIAAKRVALNEIGRKFSRSEELKRLLVVSGQGQERQRHVANIMNAMPPLVHPE